MDEHLLNSERYMASYSACITGGCTLSSFQPRMPMIQSYLSKDSSVDECVVESIENLNNNKGEALCNLKYASSCHGDASCETSALRTQVRSMIDNCLWGVRLQTDDG